MKNEIELQTPSMVITSHFKLLRSPQF